MSATVQLNTRIEPETKRAGDAVFARAGLSSSQVVRSLWSYAAATQSVPDFLVKTSEREDTRLVNKIREGSGIIRRRIEEMGIRLTNSDMDFALQKDQMYDDLLDKINDDLAAS